MSNQKKLNLVRVRISRAVQPRQLENHREAVAAGEFHVRKIHIEKTVELSNENWTELVQDLTKPQKWLKSRGGVATSRQGIYTQMVAVTRVVEGLPPRTIYIDGNKTGAPVIVALPLEDQPEVEVEPPQAPQKKKPKKPKTNLSQLLELIEDESTTSDW